MVYVPVSINADSVVSDVGVLVFSLDGLVHVYKTLILRPNNCPAVQVVVVDMRPLRLFVLDGSSFLGSCRGGMLEHGIILRGMGVRIVFLIGVVIVVYGI
jgi:hypothetical protein